MARPSKLTDDELAALRDRHINGESIRSLAKEVGMGESSLRERISAQSAQIKKAANQIVETKRTLKALPLSAQIAAHTRAEMLTQMGDRISSAGNDTALVSEMFAKAARDATSQIMFKAMGDDGETISPERLAECTEEIAAVMKSTMVSNEASKISLKLMDIAAKDKESDKGERIIHLVNDPDEQ